MLLPPEKQHFSVARAAELNAFALQLRAQLEVVVDLPGRRDAQTVIMREHRLMTSNRQVYDCETAVREHSTRLIIEARYLGQSYIIGAAMPQRLRHLHHRSARIAAREKPSDSAHQPGPARKRGFCICASLIEAGVTRAVAVARCVVPSDLRSHTQIT